MKYYAVTNDPNELMHFGIKGMKWGVIRTDAQLGHPRHSGSRRPRSAAYKKASAKLSKSMQNGIAKAQAKWKEYNSPRAKEERFMKKAMQQARNGTLKYGKLTDAQVKRVTQRLALEQDARRLGSTEQPRMAKRLKLAVGEGIVRGIGMGTASYIDARFRGRGETTAAIKKDKRMSKYEANERVIRRKAKNEAKKEYYKEQAEEGNVHSRAGSIVRLVGMEVADPRHDTFKEEREYYRRNLTQGGRAKLMAAKKAADKEEERSKRQQEAKDKAYYTHLGKLEAERDINKSTNISEPSTPKAIIKRTPAPIKAPGAGIARPHHVPVRDRDNRPTKKKHGKN